MRLIDSPVVQRDAAALPPDRRREFLDFIRYEGIYDELATNMRVLLRTRGQTQRAVAERMGTSETALSRLLHGRAVRKAKLETLVRFAQAIDIDVWDLFGDPAAQPRQAVAVAALRTMVVQPAIAVWQHNVAYPKKFHTPTVTWGSPHETRPAWAQA